MLIRSSPTKLIIQGIPKETLAPNFEYIDQKVDYQLKKFKNASWFITKYGEEAFKEELARLKATRKKSLLFEDDQLWTYTGFANWLAAKYSVPVETAFDYPEARNLPWDHPPEFPNRPYQDLCKSLLIQAKHAAVELSTGLGKTQLAATIVKELGLQTVIMAPSLNIANQFLKIFTHLFGKKYVGQFFDGKKQVKLITIAVGASLIRLNRTEPLWEALQSTKVFIADESHTTPAETLQKVCQELLGNVPYRFFLSGTQMRGDGLDLVLEGITGPIVFKMSVKEGVEQGYLAPPKFKMLDIRSDSNFFSKDANELTREHLYYNPLVNKATAEIANKSLELMDRPTLILIEEVEQFAYILPHLKYPVAFAHGPLTKSVKGKPGNRDKVPSQYWESDPNKLVDEFNQGKHKILVGTSCVSMGTDILPVKSIVYLQGGKSEVQFRQAVGRGVRKPTGKEDCLFWDFKVSNQETLKRHALERESFMEDIYGPVQRSTW